ncbi:MAG: hypothetical protein CO150_02095 [Nitrospirae bacterium CG_4_9_14_3_um_filter_53_35]|nr:MAG: hypothetical protein COT35_01025 [Nitrospirae bacterium CG08_land_8_20_14_0_20_52_24]PIW85920.1 MAG: hypothetical protein COZ95_01945 [Nitrospirae bacterium CG_4_8_14_3_um_filter_50_41]PJA77063.1 MAG: hypothetical protein CO150_02095 [Nitrospirae bacterium CG_4_9_14_3_um_filter_53_35]
MGAVPIIPTYYSYYSAGVKRLVYLGGLGVKATASRHLLSRIETGEILSARPEILQTIWFRKRLQNKKS